MAIRLLREGVTGVAVIMDDVLEFLGEFGMLLGSVFTSRGNCREPSSPTDLQFVQGADGMADISGQVRESWFVNFRSWSGPPSWFLAHGVCQLPWARFASSASICCNGSSVVYSGASMVVLPASLSSVIDVAARVPAC